MPTSQADIARLGEYARRRRTELLMTQLDVMRAGGLSNSSQSKLESGRLRRINMATLDKLDTSLRWVPGSASRVLAGGAPEPLATNTTPPAPRHSTVLEAIQDDRNLRQVDKVKLYDEYLEMLRNYGASLSRLSDADDAADDDSSSNEVDGSERIA